MDAELVVWGERVRGCGDGQLMAELQQLVRRDRRCEVRLLMYLAEVDERRLFLQQGFSCLIRYATAVLRMSGQQAYLRIQAARLARRFPVVLEMLAEGAVSLSTLKQLDQHLTDDNHVVLLDRARNKTKDEVAFLVAEIAPQDDVTTRMRKLPARAASKQTSLHARASEMTAHCGRAHPSAATNAAVSGSVPPLVGAGSKASEPAAAIPRAVSEQVPVPFALEAPRPSCTPLRPGRFKLQLTASQALHDKLMQLQHLLRHQVPDGDFGAIVERACDVLLEKTLKQRFAQVAKPRSSAVKACAAGASTRSIELGREQRACAGQGLEHAEPVARHPSSHPVPMRPDAQLSSADPESTMLGTRSSGRRSRYIPRAVLREVFARDGEQCTFVGPDGSRCNERGMLEVHHVRAFAFGGEATVENLRLVCRGHNGFFAVQDFGAAHMLRKRASSRISSHQPLLFPD
jgi:hypothetical protein